MTMFPYKCVLVVGATSGIGRGLAEKIIGNGGKVIAVGRRQENLDELVRKHGENRVSGIRFDITDLEGIPNFVDTVIKQHPDLDAVILGAGIQRGIDFSKPESIDLKSVQEELTTNYLSHVSLVKYLIPHLKSLSRSHPTALIFISSGLALLPMLRCGNYCASKAAIHQLIMTMREQLRPHIKVIEILPAAVQTELHDEKNQPEIKNGREWGMPIDEFLTEAWLGLELGQEAIPVGMTQEAWDAFEGRRVALFQGTMKQLRDPKYCGMTGEMETWIGRNISSE